MQKNIGRSQTTTEKFRSTIPVEVIFPRNRLSIHLYACACAFEANERDGELSNQFFVNTSNEFLNVDCNLLLFVHEMRKMYAVLVSR